MKPTFSLRYRALLGCLIVALLPAAASAKEVQTDDRQAADPKPSEILEKYVEAIGGKEKLQSRKSMFASGRFQIPGMGVQGAIEIMSARPHYFKLKMESPAIGSTTQVFNGEFGWMISEMMGTQLMPESQLNEMKMQSDFDLALNFEKHFKTIETVGKTEFEGASCWQLRMVRPNDREMMMFFDADTGLLKGQRGQQETAMGMVESTTVFSDYREVNGVRTPGRMTIRATGAPPQILTFDKIEFDTVDKSEFEMPEQIKQLVERQKEQQDRDSGAGSSDDNG